MTRSFYSQSLSNAGQSKEEKESRRKKFEHQLNYMEMVEDWKAEVLRRYADQDTSRPVKNTEHIAIQVFEYENKEGSVELYYSKEFRRMFGRHLNYRSQIFKGDMQEACTLARNIKLLSAQIGIHFKIEFFPYEESILY